MSLDTLLLTLHVLGACLVLGMMVASVVMTRKNILTLQNVKAFGLMGQLGGLGVSAQFITGIALVWQEPDKFLNSWIFWVKMVVIVVAGIVSTQIIKKRALQAAKNQDADALANSKLGTFAIVNLVAAIAVVCIGVYLSHLE